jgi:uncharacterized protein YgbK (DUF1537 family)
VAVNYLLLGCIADDFTGATDLANTLVRQGMRTVQTIGVPTSPIDADAIVVALKSRTIPAPDAVEQSLAALRWLSGQGCRQFLFKYCSTFDSTDVGNIGPVAEALLGALGSDFTIACPAFPENGRTVFCGHLFVGDALLNESGMEHHPLTPMTDANLVRALQRQSQAKVGLLRYDTVAQGAEAVRVQIDALRSKGIRLAIADAISDTDLLTLGQGCAALPLITGGSGIALGLPENFRRAGLLSARTCAADVPVVNGHGVVLAGCASQATNDQVAHWVAQKRPAMRVDPLRLARGEPVIDEALALVQSCTEPVLIYATARPEDVKAAQAKLGVARAGELVEHALARIAASLRARDTRCFVVAGGETAGAVVQALGVRSLRIGKQIAPGVPVAVTLDDDHLALALKSGNFGGQNFFDEALRALGALP